MSRRWAKFALAAVGLVSLSWASYRIAFGWWVEAELARATREVASGRFEEARDRLTRLSARSADDGEVHYHLGLCEEAAGRHREAIESWARIEPGSPYASLAAENRRLMLERFSDSGRFASLEETLEAVRLGTGQEAAEAGQSLARLLRIECRFDELRRLLKEEWPRAPDPIRTLRELWRLDVDPVPIEMVRGVLDRASAQAPDDDRIWLGRANLAIWSGQFDEADRWISACLERRPRDPPAWRARLDWAMATDRPAEARHALDHLTPAVLPPHRVLSLRAWLIAREPTRADAQNVRDERWRLALEDLLAADPGNSEALERLTELAVSAGDRDRIAALRRRKAELDRARHRYRDRLGDGAPRPNPPELARLAETLGRTFEAEAFWTLSLGIRPGDPEALAGLARMGRRRSEAASSPDRGRRANSWPKSPRRRRAPSPFDRPRPAPSRRSRSPTMPRPPASISSSRTANHPIASSPRR